MKDAEGIDINDLEKTLRLELAAIARDAEQTLGEVVESAGKKLVVRLRQRSPRRTGEYAAGWEGKAEYEGVSRVYRVKNAQKPQLTHLLEYGRRGVIGDERVGAKPHIRIALRETLEEIDDELMKKL